MRVFTAFGTGVLALMLAGSLQAAPAQCATKIDSVPVHIFYDDAEPIYSSFRERCLTRSGTCPGAVVISHLMPDLTAEERQVFCANYDPKTRSHSMPALGRRDAFGRSVEPSRTCRVVNTTKQQAMESMGIGAQAESGTLAGRLSSAVSAVTHGSGAMVLSGNTGTISSMLGSVGTTVGTALGSSTVLAGAAASLVVIGGAVYLCSDGR